MLALEDQARRVGGDAEKTLQNLSDRAVVYFDVHEEQTSHVTSTTPAPQASTPAPSLADVRIEGPSGHNGHTRDGIPLIVKFKWSAPVRLNDFNESSGAVIWTNCAPLPGTWEVKSDVATVPEGSGDFFQVELKVIDATSPVTVAVEPSLVHSSTGALSRGGKPLTIPVDMTPPKADFDVPPATNGPFTATISWSEPVAGFDIDDLIVIYGAVTDFTVEKPGRVFNAIVAPASLGVSGGSDTIVRIPPRACTDGAGNASTESKRASVVFDVTRPVCRLDAPYATAPTDSFNVKVVCDSRVYGLEAESFTVDGGLIAGITALSGSSGASDSGETSSFLLKVAAASTTVGNTSGSSDYVYVQIKLTDNSRRVKDLAGNSVEPSGVAQTLIGCFADNSSYVGAVLSQRVSLSPAECHQACANEMDCAFFSYVTSESLDDYQTCYLLGTHDETFEVDGVLSGPRSCGS
jgi:hypothetical protein